MVSFDPDGDSLFANVPSTSTEGGQVVLNPDGTIQYIAPHGTYEGNDTVFYEVCDNGTPSLCVNDTLFLTVIFDNPPTGGNERDTVYEDSISNTVNVLLNESDPENDPLVVFPISPTAMGGSASYNPSDSSIIYQSALNYCGEDTIVYEVCDDAEPINNCIFDTVFLHVICLNDGPMNGNEYVDASPVYPLTNLNVTANNIDPEGDSIIASDFIQFSNVGELVQNPDGTINYTVLSLEYEGIDTIVYTVCDVGSPSLCNQDTIFISVLQNVAPQSGTEYLTVDEDSDLSDPLNVLRNNPDPENDAVSATVPTTSAMNGSVIYFRQPHKLLGF